MDPGTALAIVSLTFQAFGGCIQVFTLVSSAQSLGNDAAVLQTMLNLEEFRLVQWADKIGLTDPNATIDPRLNLTLALEILGQLRNLLEADKLKERYKLDLRPLESDEHGSELRSGQSVLSRLVSDETRLSILSRSKLIQKQNSVPKRLWWAAVDKNKLETLVKDVRVLVQGLWDLLDALQQDDILSKVDLALLSLVSISSDVAELKTLHGALQSDTATNRRASPITTIASLKATRLQIGEIDDSEDAAGAVNVTAARRRAMLLPSLSLSSLTSFISNPSDPSVGLAIDGGEYVYVERKHVPRNLRGKLRKRVENLAILLNSQDDTKLLTLHCKGFVEIPEGFAFVFTLPPQYNDAAMCSSSMVDEKGLPMLQPSSLLDLLRSPLHQPTVTQRLDVALAISRTVLALHGAGWLHKDIRSANILFFQPGIGAHNLPDMTRAFLTHFAFSRVDSPTEISELPSSSPQTDIYRHPNAMGEPSVGYTACMDLYSLAVMMIEIAEWRPLKALVKKFVDVSKGDVPMQKIAHLHDWLKREKIDSGIIGFRMGQVYERSIRRLWEHASLRAGDEDESVRLESMAILGECVTDLGRCRV